MYTCGVSCDVGFDKVTTFHTLFRDEHMIAPSITPIHLNTILGEQTLRFMGYDLVKRVWKNIRGKSKALNVIRVEESMNILRSREYLRSSGTRVECLRSISNFSFQRTIGIPLYQDLSPFMRENVTELKWQYTHITEEQVRLHEEQVRLKTIN
ncbi:hypothetical protein Fot_20770 [Forsythia ovata]|uniref:Uncharacterized protein n=1 Tax=Forsythia ovata TaxID=205694 RepID=A0ABD1UT34_9LAMI